MAAIADETSVDDATIADIHQARCCSQRCYRLNVYTDDVADNTDVYAATDVGNVDEYDADRYKIYENFDFILFYPRVRRLHIVYFILFFVDLPFTVCHRYVSHELDRCHSFQCNDL